ncbi:cupin domain-containing protein [Micromonospora sp. DPT]|uniref:cupin domain-containing protein n=1 Tax=Micromonospora sp. DPT TaxID=3142975 RepID=UPI0032080D3E
MRFVREDDVTSTPPASGQFSEGVWRTVILDPAQDDGLRAHRFSYPPGARSAWHTHEGEQAILVVSGQGIVVRWGESVGTPIGPGDWVHVEPGEKHWHGSVPENTLIHIAVTASGGTDWEEAVSDQEYRVATSVLTSGNAVPSDPLENP